VSTEKKSKSSLWQKALSLAEQTPDSRNRYVDLLRALSIIAVVIGHWIISAPFLDGGRPTLPHILDISPWTHWLTWLFQVMPVFFFVGGYSNYTAWEASQKKGQSYSVWLSSRLQRLLYPVLPLILGWALLAILGQLFGLPQSYIQVASQIAIVPTWFLAVYILVVLFVPLTYRAWQKFGLLSIAPLLLGAAILDWGFFNLQWYGLAWFNYLFVWLAIHQIGFGWRAGVFGRPLITFWLCPLALLALYLLVTFGPYPLSLVGVPGDEISNTLPPKLPLLLLGLAQIALCMSLEPLAKVLLSNKRVWAGVILINAMIMTLFLWHSTAMMLVIGSVFLLMPELYNIYPGSSNWWLSRPLWILAYALATLPLLLLFSKYENPKKAENPPGLISLFFGCLLTSAAIGYLAKNGFGGAAHWIIDGSAIALVVIGVSLIGALRAFRPQEPVPQGE